MSAPSDGARADARKRLAAETIPLALSDLLAEVSWDIEFGGRSFSDQARLILASDWLAGVIADAKAEAWDERDRAWATYPDPHPEDCMGWEDCDCASYPNPYRDVTE